MLGCQRSKVPVGTASALNGELALTALPVTVLKALAGLGRGRRALCVAEAKVSEFVL